MTTKRIRPTDEKFVYEYQKPTTEDYQTCLCGSILRLRREISRGSCLKCKPDEAKPNDMNRAIGLSIALAMKGRKQDALAVADEWDRNQESK